MPELKKKQGGPGSPIRIAAFGLRTLPPGRGAAGADTFAAELYPRLAAKGHVVTAYCRRYKGDPAPESSEYRGVKLVHLPTVSWSGFDSLVHSFLATVHIIFKNTGDVVHVHNGGNSIWSLPLRVFSKRVIISQDGIDWQREKWRWYARWYLRLSMYATAFFPTMVVFDNVYARDLFRQKFRRQFPVIPYGSEVEEPASLSSLGKFSLSEKGYFLFVGRFIPEKGIHYLIKAFEGVATGKRLVVVGGSPNRGSEYEGRIRLTGDKRIHFIGYVYGEEMLELMKGCYCYVQPSDVEGLSPVILTAMGLGVPILCSNIQENLYAVGDTAMTFEKGNVGSLREQIQRALTQPAMLDGLACRARERARALFSWDRVADSFEQAFARTTLPGDLLERG